MLDAKPNLT